MNITKSPLPCVRLCELTALLSAALGSEKGGSGVPSGNMEEEVAAMGAK
jgi:hypothetical protein